MTLTQPRLALTTLVTGILLITIFAVTVGLFRAELRNEIHDKIVARDAAVLYPIAESQLQDAEADPSNHAFVAEMLLPAVLKAVPGTRGVAIYDADGNVLETSPSTLIRTELAPADYDALLAGNQISRYHADFPLDRSFNDYTERARAPILEVLLPLHSGTSGETAGFVRYLIDGRPLGAELQEIDERVNRQTAETLGIGSALIALVLGGAYFGLARAQRIIAERNDRLTRANFELTLAAKTSALGVITSHLIHGLQGSVAGLRAVVADHTEERAGPEWESAATYTERMQTMIHETVALLGDTSTQTSYELSGAELAATIRERNRGAAVAKGVLLHVGEGFPQTLDSHRGSLLCLIATNLVQNAIEATDPGRHIHVMLTHSPAAITLEVRDEGHGLPDHVRAHLFEPGRTGRAGGTGLGLAISQLLSRNLGGALDLVTTSGTGTTFRLTVPLG
jgi:signal transduction histidine kinase